MPRQYTYEKRAEFFDLVCGGSSLQGASDSIGVARATGVAWWQQSAGMDLKIVKGARGGLATRAPQASVGLCSLPGRQRRVLTSEDRATIASGVAWGMSYRQIGALIGRDKSVISREVTRHRGPDGAYYAPLAHQSAHQARARPKAFKLIENPGLCAVIEAQMKEGWSPRLIAQMLTKEHGPSTAKNKMDLVSHETIYRALYVQTRGLLRADLHKQLSLKRRQRKTRTTPSPSSTRYKEAFAIADRPADVEDRAVPGHWEADLICGSANRSAVGTLVERSTRFTILLHLPGRHDADAVAEAMIREMSQLPEHLRRSITYDRGVEMMGYRKIQLALSAPVYFCDPRSPWQRGTNENTNRLLRHWLPKGTDLSIYTAEDLREIAATLNRRPRPTLDLDTPTNRLNALLTAV